MFIIIPESHLDHNVSTAILNHVLKTFADRDGFFIETIELPPELGTLSCALYGPEMGDAPVEDGPDVFMGQRQGRNNPTRFIQKPSRPTNRMTIIAGPNKDDAGHIIAGQECVLYTLYGGPPATREPGDTSLPKPSREHQSAVAFWAGHALSEDLHNG